MTKSIKEIKEAFENFEFNFKSEKQEKYYNELMESVFAEIDEEVDMDDGIESIYYHLALASFDDEIEESASEWTQEDCIKYINDMMTKDAFSFLKELS